ncbi:MAG: TldD/PmbA family protein [Bacteroidetes bacterium]|nr:TldD/PmbA family protein [Bacteroidota bacterium]
MKLLFRDFIFAAFFLLSFPVIAQNDTLMGILKEELWREFNELQTQEYPPYYMEFKAVESFHAGASSSMGSTLNYTIDKSKSFSPTIRIGSYKFDNTHSFDNEFSDFYSGFSNFTLLPRELNPDLVKYTIWETTNDLYKDVLETYQNKLDKLDSAEMNNINDFSQEVQTVYDEAPLPTSTFDINMDQWKEKLNKYTEIFKGIPEITIATASLGYSIDRVYFINTEKSEITQNKQLCLLTLMVLGRTEEDEFMPYSQAYYAFTPEGLPPDSIIMADMVNIRDKVLDLCKAPKAEPYTGPAILSAEAAGVFFHEILGHRIEGHRMENSFNSKTFKDKIDREVINKSISVYSDPTQSTWEGKDLIGFYKYDDQGIQAQKVMNIEEGKLKNFLMSRKPIEGFDHSNGHGRANLAMDPVARQSNLFVESNDPESFTQLKKKLLKECKKQKKEYGYYFKTVSGGFTNTMNYQPDYFNILPIEVYRIYVDGRADELVKGVNLIGTPLIMFSEILAAGDVREVFSGMCGAESGSVPVSTIAPAMLVRKVETQNQFSYKPDWPILPDPETEAIQQNILNYEQK